VKKLVLAFVLTAATCVAQEAARFDEVIKPYVDAHRFMGSVLIARDSGVVFEKSFGSANLEWNIPNSPTTKFRLGSITKQFTAASILLLEERGKLKIDDPVKTYLPDAPAAWDRITIFNLLTHSSGIPNFTSFPNYRSIEPFATTPEKLVALFRDKPLDFAPGEKYVYSNSGYVLLGYLIEKVAGQSYESFVQQNIFTPLGMKDSGYDSNSAIIDRRAAGYTLTPKGFTNAGFIDMTIPFSAGALYSTTEDLLRWEQGIFGGKVVSAASLKKMTTPFKGGYAFGLLINTNSGRTAVFHNGGIEGFNTAMAYYPDSTVTVIVLGNVNGTAPDELVDKLGRVANGEKILAPSERTAVALPRETLASYVGVYRFAPTFSIAITLDGDQLFEQASNQVKIPIYPESDTKFFLKIVDAQLEFHKDASGAVTSLVLHQAGRDITGTRQ
jgi:CubicO group peptidase (beta-lactamase class C family)